MKKYLMILALCLCCALLFAACGCEHEWEDADCENPKTCALCGATEGSPEGHSWLAETCETPKTCEICGKTQGEAPGHSWVEATCVDPKTCSKCNITEGEAPGHDWQDATTDAPKTCATCQLTQGSKLNVDSRFTTDATKHLYGSWSSDFVMTGEMMGLPGYFDDLDCQMIYEFTKDGKVIASVEFADEEAYIKEFKRFTVDLTYASLAEQGYGKAAADAAMEQAYGMNVAEYVDATVAEMSHEDLFGSMDFEMVYYVDGELLYWAEGWAQEFAGFDYKLENDILSLDDPELGWMDFVKVEAE